MTTKIAHPILLGQHFAKQISEQFNKMFWKFNTVVLYARETMPIAVFTDQKSPCNVDVCYTDVMQADLDFKSSGFYSWALEANTKFSEGS